MKCIASLADRSAPTPERLARLDVLLIDEFDNLTEPEQSNNLLQLMGSVQLHSTIITTIWSMTSGHNFLGNKSYGGRAAEPACGI